MQCGKYMVSTGCQGLAVVAMQGEGCLRAQVGHSVRAVACACHSGTPPRTPFLHRNPRPFLHKNHPRNPEGTPFLHRTPLPSFIGTPLPGPLPRPFLDHAYTRIPPPLPAQEPPSWTKSCPLSSLAFCVLLVMLTSTFTRGWH